MAEWALWAALDFFRDGPLRREDKAQSRWIGRDSREICGSRWLVIGFGAIGAAVGRRVRALGGQVTGVRRSGGASQDADSIEKSLSPDLLGAADVVLIALPHTPETEGLVDASFLASMRREALLLNLGRGVHIDEPALMAALDAGRPAFAWLDVASREPLPADNPLWRHPRVMITGHDSSRTTLSQGRADGLFLRNLEAWLDGQPMQHVMPRSAFEELAPGGH